MSRDKKVKLSTSFTIKWVLILTVILSAGIIAYGMLNQVRLGSLNPFMVTIGVLMFPIMVSVVLMIVRAFWMCKPSTTRAMRYKTVVNTKSFSNAPIKISPEQLKTNVSVLIPVYTESFSIIKDTIEYALISMGVYEKSSKGKTNLVVCDDALMVWAGNDLYGFEERARSKDESERSELEAKVLERVDYYRSKGVGFVSRPKPIQGIEVTARRGMFKKAGNVNHTVKFSEEIISLMNKGLKREEALQKVLSYNEFSYSHAEGDVCLNDIILILDKDSYTPPDAIINTVPEFVQDASLGFTQNKTIPLNQNENFFTRISCYFTYNFMLLIIQGRALMDGIVYFVGHNAFIRKSVLIEVSYFNELGVAEDIDFTFKVYSKGYHGKFIHHKDCHFGEYVTLDFQTESKRFMRYCFGTLQSVFNPIADWFKKGVFSPSFSMYLRSPYSDWANFLDTIIFGVSLIYLSWFFVGQVLLVFTSVSFYNSPITDTGLIFVVSVLLLSIRTKDFLLFNVKSFGDFLKNFICFFFNSIMMSCVSLYIVKGVIAFFFSIKSSFAVTSVESLDGGSIIKTFSTVTKAFKIYFVLFFSILVISFIYLKSIGVPEDQIGKDLMNYVLTVLFPYFTYQPLLDAIRGIFRFGGARTTLIDE
ncbi:MAG TPA: glycosyltransferase family 2 protein [Clostridia bacterium]|nr:glycosyltransferase family 2 protein [Clostridia bacterium]